MIEVSIIVPTYNVEKYLYQALDSAVNQTLQNIEILCIDNCSTDATLNILKEYEDKDNRIRIICNAANKGCSYSRNVGVKAARGEYILFLDADDELKSDTAEIAYRSAKKDALDILFFQAIREYENIELEQMYGNIHDTYFKSNDIFRGTEIFLELADKLSYALTLWGKLFRKEFLLEETLSFHEGILHEDIPYTFRAVLTAARTKVISNELYIHRKRGGSLTTSEKEEEGFRGWLAGYCDMLKYWVEIQDKIDKNISAKIESFLSGKYRMLFYKISGHEEMMELNFSDPFENHIYKTLLRGRKYLSEEQKQIEKQYSKIIVYGAGRIAGRILGQLDEKRMLGIAVTDTAHNPEVKNGYAIKEINAYREYRDEALVIVAVTEKFHDEIRKKLKQEGFKHAIYIL